MLRTYYLLFDVLLLLSSRKRAWRSNVHNTRIREYVKREAERPQQQRILLRQIILRRTFKKTKLVFLLLLSNLAPSFSRSTRTVRWIVVAVHRKLFEIIFTFLQSINKCILCYYYVCIVIFPFIVQSTAQSIVLFPK